MKIILTHINADFDAVASMLAAYKLNAEAKPVLPERLLRSVSEFLTLYSNGLPFVKFEDFDPSEAISHITLTDAQTIPVSYGIESDDIPTTIIEHHKQERKLKSHETWIGETLGATTTLLIEKIREHDISINSLEATLMMLGIYADTGMLTYGATTPRDIMAAAWLLEQGASLDTVRRYMTTPLGKPQQDLLEDLLANQQHQTIAGYDIVICTAEAAEMVSEISTVTTQLRDMLDPAALFTVVTLPSHVQLVCRSTYDNIDAGAVARLFGGGGHTRAAAAAVYDQENDDVVQGIWAHLNQAVQPAVRVGDLMSQGVQTVMIDDKLHEIIMRLRRIGHEGYPVLKDGSVVGLLTLRDANRALEHALPDVTAGDVMQAGLFSLGPDSSVMALEQVMVKSGWGQIPIVHNDTVTGIVTRTDLIQHWANTHPQVNEPTQPNVDAQTLKTILGKTALGLIEKVADDAQKQSLGVYIVGGIVRDLLLERANHDIDFVIEGNAITFAEYMQANYGGNVHSYAPFGTATWHIDEHAASAMGLAYDGLPDHIDFASARNEYYLHPTALPTVYSGSIKLDLGRRDFTINTLAIQISPAAHMWRIVDYYSGLDDLKNGVIRVLHSLSFVDDPTRILRAVRFAERLHFKIEPRTSELIASALPMLRRITGERVRNELNLLLKETSPESGIYALERLGALQAIHPALEPPEHLGKLFKRLRARDLHLQTDAYWHILLSHLSAEDIAAVGERLLFSNPLINAIQATHTLLYDLPILKETSPRPSRITMALNGIPEASLQIASLLAGEPISTYIRNYLERWRDVRPLSDGNTLKEMGLPAGPQYSQILQRLKNAWLDGEISNKTEEQVLLEKLVQEAHNNDDT